MLFCQKHQMKGFAYAGGGGPCVQCSRDCDPPGTLCPACSLKLDQCRVCHEVVNSGRSARMVRSIEAAERRRDHTLRVAENRRAKVVDPIAHHVATYQQEVEAARAPLVALQIEYTKLEEPTLDRYKGATRAGGQAFETAAAALRELRAKHAELMAPQRAATEAAIAAAEAKFAPYKDAWSTAESTCRTLVWRAGMLFDARVNQLAGHFAVDQGYKAECERVNSQTR